jgi:hypothetical protein
MASSRRPHCLPSNVNPNEWAADAAKVAGRCNFVCRFVAKRHSAGDWNGFVSGLKPLSKVSWQVEIWHGSVAWLVLYSDAGLRPVSTRESTSVNEQSDIRQQTEAPAQPDQDEAKQKDRETTDKGNVAAPENSCSLQLERFHSS